MITPARSLHHLSAKTLDKLEKEVLRMNLILARATETFQVEKVGDEWFAYFNIDSVVFNGYLQSIKKLKLTEENPRG